MKLKILFILSLLLFSACSSEKEIPLTPEDKSIQPKLIDLTADNFNFSEEIINVKLGQKVIILLKSEKDFHNFAIDEFDVKSNTVNTGEETQTSFIAGKKGTFLFYCSVGDHKEKGQFGTLVVE